MLLSFLVLASVSSAPVAGRSERLPVLRVAAASDLQRAFPLLRSRLETVAESPISFTFGASVTLARQIEQGAPFALFVSANREAAAWLHQTKFCAGPPVPFARGKLVLVAAGGRSPTLAELSSAKHIAIANPKVAPFGQAAWSALSALPGWASLSTRLVVADNVGMALQWVDSENADFGLVAESLVQKDRARLAMAHDVALDITALACAAEGTPAQAATTRLLDWLTSAAAANELRAVGVEPVGAPLGLP